MVAIQPRQAKESHSTVRNARGREVRAPAGAAGRHVVRREPEELIHWAQLMESLRKGAGQHFIIGVMGRDYGLDPV